MGSRPLCKREGLRRAPPTSPGPCRDSPACRSTRQQPPGLLLSRGRLPALPDQPARSRRTLWLPRARLRKNGVARTGSEPLIYDLGREDRTHNPGHPPFRNPVVERSPPAGGEASTPLQCAARTCGRPYGGVSCAGITTTSKPSAFEVTSKRRKGFPSETNVKRGYRVVRGDKELLEKLGRNDPCPCLSGRRFQALLHAQRGPRRLSSRPLLSDSRALVI
jgi:hypothetical protein